MNINEMMSSLYAEIITFCFLVLKCLHQFSCSSYQKQGSPSTITINFKKFRSFLFTDNQNIVTKDAYRDTFIKQGMLFSIVPHFGNMWFLLCLEQLDADWLNGCVSGRFAF